MDREQCNKEIEKLCEWLSKQDQTYELDNYVR